MKTMKTPTDCHSRLERESSVWEIAGWIPVSTGMTELKKFASRHRGIAGWIPGFTGMTGLKNRGIFFAVVMSFFAVFSSCAAQDFSNLFFLHHSVGNGLVVEGDMHGAVNGYNSANGTQFAFWDHGYNSDGLRNPAGEETGTNYEVPEDNTNPDGLYYLWTSSDASHVACRDLILANHQVIAFKSCYPASHVYDAGTLDTYKSYYLAMRDFFDSRPDRLFVVMSPPPLHRLDTNATEGYYARAFADWLKSAEYLAGHANTVCFDLFGYLAGSDNFLNYNYESSHGGSDSHPNALADQTVGPVFAQFLIDSAIAYQSSTPVVAAVPTIKVNGATNEIAVAYPDPVTVTVEMDPGGYTGSYRDWWVVAYDHSGQWYYMDGSRQWINFSGNLGECRPAYQGALFNLPATAVLSDFTLPRGTYDFWFAVDAMDGVLNVNGSLQYGKVTVVVE